MQAVRRHARTAVRCWHLQRVHRSFSRSACYRRDADDRTLRFICREVFSASSAPTCPCCGTCEKVSAPVADRSQGGQLFAEPDVVDWLESQAGPCATAMRTVAGRGGQPQRRPQTTSPGSSTRTATCSHDAPPERRVAACSAAVTAWPSSAAGGGRMNWDSPQRSSSPRARSHADEYRRIPLGARPDAQPHRAGIFAALWSEHCSYKSSRVHFSRFPTSGPRVLQGPGERGIVDVGRVVVVFKMESHNHPSFIEPYQVQRLGWAHPARRLHMARARSCSSTRCASVTRGSADEHLVEWRSSVVGDYGNCVGAHGRRRARLPSVLQRQHPGQRMCVGVARRDGIFFAHASGVGNRIVYLGSRTAATGSTARHGLGHLRR